MWLSKARKFAAKSRQCVWSYKARNFSSVDFTAVSNQTELKWQRKWEQEAALKTDQFDPNKKKFYCLSMFPYPSGQLHIGHVRVYTISDCLARLHKMQGYDVLHPMGWDAFGLPAENAAIERGVSPDEWTKLNIASAKKQMKSLGIVFDWDREVTTCSPEYYKWTQWIFLQLKEKGLAYQKEALVNWDPIDQTVLANEQVDAQGNSWRSGAKVEQKNLRQWFLRISDYSDRLVDDIDQLEDWPEAVKKMQKSWIGRSIGAEIHFSTDSLEVDPITVFTTRPDTLYGVTYLALAPESAIVDSLMNSIPSQFKSTVQDYLSEVIATSKEKRQHQSRGSNGVYIGIDAVHPLTNKKVPIFLADYVLAEYGTGAVMGVPAHDDRDERFAEVHKLNTINVISPSNTLENSDHFNGLTAADASKAITEKLSSIKAGNFRTQIRLRDWLVSRQRYWGTPVPIIHCGTCGPVSVPLKDLPVTLPKNAGSENLRGGSGGSPLARNLEWKTTKCPECGGEAHRDTDTLDTFVDSSWYFMRYVNSKNDEQPFSKDAAKHWLSNGVDLYVGGIEHAILHLLYSRFITKFFYDQEYLPNPEPFSKLLTQGMVLGKTYKSPDTARYLKPDEIIKKIGNNDVFEVATGRKLSPVWEKMSKSKYNGVDPQVIQKEYGADVARLLVLFKAPPSHELEWDEADLNGQSRWLNRIWLLIKKQMEKSTSDEKKSIELDAAENRLKELLHLTIQKVTEAIGQTHSFNVAIAELMKFSNLLAEEEISILRGRRDIYRESIEKLVIMLAPLAPHNAAEMYEVLSGDKINSVHDQHWPSFDKSVISNLNVKIVVQIKGKIRDTINVPLEMQSDKSKMEEVALQSEKVRKYIGDQKIRKVVVVPAKKKGMHNLVNIVV